VDRTESLDCDILHDHYYEPKPPLRRDAISMTVR
jgi:hypothetical protein